MIIKLTADTLLPDSLAHDVDCALEHVFIQTALSPTVTVDGDAVTVTGPEAALRAFAWWWTNGTVALADVTVAG